MMFERKIGALERVAIALDVAINERLKKRKFGNETQQLPLRACRPVATIIKSASVSRNLRCDKAVRICFDTLSLSRALSDCLR